MIPSSTVREITLQRHHSVVRQGMQSSLLPWRPLLAATLVLQHSAPSMTHPASWITCFMSILFRVYKGSNTGAALWSSSGLRSQDLDPFVLRTVPPLDSPYKQYTSASSTH